jgi:predicted deacylase
MAVEPPGGWRIEIEPPDLDPHRAGNTGIDYVTTLDSGHPGPHLMISALVHGNELCGAVVLDRLLREGIQPRQGKLTLVFVNVAAHRQFDPRAPLASRFVDEDFNRLWDVATLEGPRDSVELRRARELRPLIDTVDVLLDLHSMQQDSPPLTLCGITAKGLRLARELGYPIHVVSDAGHAGGTRLRDYAEFDDPDSSRNALLVECGQHWRASSVDVAWRVTRRFLTRFGVLQADEAGPDDAQQLIRVTTAISATSARFRFVDDYRGMEVIPRAGTVIARDNGRTIATPYDDCVLVMPVHGVRPGQTAVRLGQRVSESAD